jgi:hypothetical protein
MPLSDPILEGHRLAEAVVAAELNLRLVGGIGIAIRCPSAGNPPLKRPYGDIDLAGLSKERPLIERLLVEGGYHPDQQFNAVHGARRLLFWDQDNGRQVDVFLDRVDMCHSIQLHDRVRLAGPTLPLADLLLLKLQIIEANAKDFSDTVALVADHPLSDDDEGINIRYLSDLAARDWGLWRTTTMVAERAAAYARGLQGFAQASQVTTRLGEYVDALERTPKTRSWRLRARVGDRKRWYELPENVE